MTENFVIICTIGRTGSSLLINILNHLESTCFCGELIGENALLKLRNKEKITYEDLRISTYDSFHLKKINTRGNQYYCPKNCLFTKLTPNDISEKLLKANNAKDVLNTLLNSDSKTKGFRPAWGKDRASLITNGKSNGGYLDGMHPATPIFSNRREDFPHPCTNWWNQFLERF